MRAERSRRMPDSIAHRVSRTCANMVRYIVHTMDDQRSDRLWPADYMVFETNPLSIAYGACGIALFLRDACGELPARAATWIRDRPLSIDTYPPGLYCGLSGISYALRAAGLEEKAAEAEHLADRSPLLHAEAGLYDGTAGWGFARLARFRRNGDAADLEKARDAGEYLVQTAERTSGGLCFWRRQQDGLIHYGFGFGSSGIALFLLHLSSIAGDSTYRDVAIAALEHDLANGIRGSLGWQWPRFEGDTVGYPYWMHGSAGVAAVLIRFHRLLRVERYGVLADHIAQDTFVKYAFAPGLFDGLAGIGELMLDMFCSTGDAAWRDLAFDIAETILWFRIETPGGTAFPGGWLTRISNDYATGAAGIGMFLRRLLQPGPRLFVDLDAM